MIGDISRLSKLNSARGIRFKSYCIQKKKGLKNKMTSNLLHKLIFIFSDVTDTKYQKFNR